GVEVVLGPGRLKATDLLYGAGPVGTVRADDERRLAVAEEALLQRALEHQLLFSRAARNPIVEVAVQRGRLDPAHLRVAKVAQHPVEVRRAWPVIDVELDEDFVVATVLVEPGVDVASLGLRLERRSGLVVLLDILAGEVAYAEPLGQRLDLGR